MTIQEFCDKHGAPPPVRSGPLLALWDAAFESFKSAADAARIGDIPGGGFDRAARMWTDFEEIIKHLKANATNQTGLGSEVDAAKALCSEIGCSKIGRICDESPQDCEIVRKIMGGKT